LGLDWERLSLRFDMLQRGGANSLIRRALVVDNGCAQTTSAAVRSVRALVAELRTRAVEVLEANSYEDGLATVVSDSGIHCILLDWTAGRNDRTAQAQASELLRIRPGEKVPVDGVVVEGSRHVDESMLTGEPEPIRKTAGSPLSAGTTNGSGTLLMRAERVGGDTLLSQIVHWVADAQRSRAPVQKIVDRVSAVFVPAVLGVALVAAVAWAVLGPEPRLTLALQDEKVDAYWLVYPIAAHDWPPLAALRQWLRAQLDDSARAWSASDASPVNPPARRAAAGRTGSRSPSRSAAPKTRRAR
jgi:hypothetical protein